MIARIWHGWTSEQNADAYEKLLGTEIFPGIESKGVSGLRSIQLFRGGAKDGEVEFVTILCFDSWEAVKAFAGESYHTAYVPPSARAILSRYDHESQHYEIVEERRYGAH